MAMWPFGKKENQHGNKHGKDEHEEHSVQPDNAPNEAVAEQGSAEPYAENPDTPFDAAAAAGVTPGAGNVVAHPHDAVNGSTGPFDGDSVDIQEFDFTDFSVGILDLGSLKIPMPKDSQVQVELGEEGPRMIHIVTRVGRITAVAFAAPRSSGQWASAATEIMAGMVRDGLSTHLEEGPWGTEIVGQNPNGSVRIIGVEGPRWLLRMTLAAPQGLEKDLAELAREVTARTFVYRGDTPILAGNSLPVTMPQQLVEQVRQAMEQREAQAREAESQQPQPGTPGVPDPQAEDAAAQQLRDLRDEDSK